MTTFVTVVMFKKTFRRPRPALKNPPYRIKNLRGNEIDCSWPSGDTAQAMHLATYLTMNMPFVLDKIPFGRVLIVLWVLQVAFCRVFFHCHYIGDTIGGASVAFFVGLINTAITRSFVVE